MLFLTIFVLLLGCAIGVTSSVGNVKCATNLYPPNSTVRVDSYTVSLDEDPSTRWNLVLTAKGNDVLHALATLKQFLRDAGMPFLIEVLDSPKWNWLLNQFPTEYQKEMQGISTFLKVPIGEVVMFNSFYEFYTVCTSIVAKDSNGKLFHARNLDFGLFLGWDDQTHKWQLTEALRKIVININWQKNGGTLFKSVNFAGFIGVLTGIKPDKFTLSLNERFNIDGGYMGLIEWYLGKRNDQWSTFLTRDIFEKENDFGKVKLRLQKEVLIAPAYYILGGRQGNEGCVITRSRHETLDIWNLGDPVGGWFVLETNYDRWKAPLIIDDRRTPALACMHNMTQNGVSFSGIFNLLSTKPVLNLLTTYTALMQVNSGELHTFIQDCPQPCFPW